REELAPRLERAPAGGLEVRVVLEVQPREVLGRLADELIEDDHERDVRRSIAEEVERRREARRRAAEVRFHLEPDAVRRVLAELEVTRSAGARAPGAHNRQRRRSGLLVVE